MKERWTEKRNELISSNDEESNDEEHLMEQVNEEDNESSKVSGKRKVCFISLKNKIIFYDLNLAPAKQTDSNES